MIAVRAALARGETRMSVRVENMDSDRDVDLLLAGVARPGRTQLEVTPRVRGLVADLYTQEGQLISRGHSIIDLRNANAGGFYLRVYNPDGAVAEDIDFEIAVKAPLIARASSES